MEDALTMATSMAVENNSSITKTIKAVSKKLFGFIKQRVGNTEDAEDILQDVFYQFVGNTQPIEQATVWLYKVARNKIIDKYRKHKFPLIDDIFKTDDVESFNWKEMLLLDDKTPETAYLHNIFWEELKLALDELPNEQRIAFIQHEIEDIPFNQIAEQQSVSVATLISRKHYAVLHLRERLQTLKNELLNY